MSEYKVMAYNIEHMRKLFYKGKFDPEKEERVKSLVKVIHHEQPHILGIVEASEKIGNHQFFLENTILSECKYKIAKSDYNRKKHDLVFYYRDPFELISLDENVDFYDQWIEDIDHDGIKEVCEFERKPLEGLFRIKGTDTTFMVILVATKSKGVFSVNDLINHQYLALANRKRLLAQSGKIRSRVDIVMDENPDLPIIVMGDFNDEPGMDSYERMLGASSIETVMGSIYKPKNILHNTLWHLSETRKKDLWTTEYPDLIVQNIALHKAWLDHIFISQNLLDDESPSKLKYIQDSGDIAKKDADSKLASDHYPIYCKFTG
ncbi:MAG: hypothetical protein ACI86H_003015 [bacterium]|jgi:hypothetical protein